MPAGARKPHTIPRNRARLALPQAELRYIPALYAPARAAELCASLLAPDALPWRSDEIRLFGRWVRQPRLTVWMADPDISYRYSGITMSPVRWTRLLSQVRSDVEAAAGCRFNSVLINLYRDGGDHMGWHRDNERELGPEPVIASLSLGATRFFDLRHLDYRDNGMAVQRFELKSGDLIVMRGATQRHWQHRVPRQLRTGEARINLSFRLTSVAPHTPHS